MDFYDYKQNFVQLNKENIEKKIPEFLLFEHNPAKYKITLVKKEELNEENDTTGFGKWELKNKKRQLAAKAFGVVLYMEPKDYSENIEENKSIHFPFLGCEEESDKVVYIAILSAIFTFFHPNMDIKDIIIGHEHGTKLKKCHLQSVVILNKETRNYIYPLAIDFEWVNNNVPFKKRLLMMNAAAKDLSGKNLIKYCRKEGDWFSLTNQLIPIVYKKDKNGEITNQIDIWGTLSKCRANCIPIEIVKEFCASKMGRDFWLYKKNLWATIEDEFGPKVEPFRWVPNERIFSNPLYKPIKDWFYTYCDNENAPSRKVALLIFSKRGMGKTEFVKSLVSDPSYIQTFNSCFQEPDCADPKLIILDDFLPIRSDSTYSNWETFKKAISSELDTIRDCQINRKISKKYWGLPCIILTNSEIFVKQMLNQPEFYSQIIFFYVNEFLGPPGTFREDLNSLKIGNEDEEGRTFFQNLLDCGKKEKEEYYIKKKRKQNAPIDIVNSLQTISDTLNELISIQKTIPMKLFKKEEKKKEEPKVEKDQNLLKDIGFFK